MIRILKFGTPKKSPVIEVVEIKEEEAGLGAPVITPPGKKLKRVDVTVDDVIRYEFENL